MRKPYKGPKELALRRSALADTISVRSISSNSTKYSPATSSGATETFAWAPQSDGTLNAKIGGTKTTGDTVTIRVKDLGLAGGFVDVTYTVLSGDNLSSIAAGLGTAINNKTELQALGISASWVSTIINIKSCSPNFTAYEQSTSGGATETISLSTNVNPIQYAIIGGAKTTGDVLKLAVFDAGLTGASETISYTVQSGDTLTSIATGLTSAVNANSDLNSVNIKATSTGTTITIRSPSNNLTSYSQSVSDGATELVSLPVNTNPINLATIGGSKTTGDVLTLTSATRKTYLSSVSVLGTRIASSASGGATASLQLSSDNTPFYRASLSGTLTTGNVLTLTFNSPRLETGPVMVSRTVQSGDNLDSFMTALTSDINSNSTLQALGINASFLIGIITISTKAVNRSLSYDGNGNLLNDGQNAYEWDAENRLIKITYPGSGNNSQMTYDGLSRNVKIVENAGGSTTSTMQFVWCDQDRCEERDSGGALTKQFFSRGQKTSSAIYFYSKDFPGSVREMTDSSGAMQAQYAFDPYGREIKIQGPLAPDFRFAGYYVHEPSGLNYTLTRSYSPPIGRWTARDPIEEDGGINLYAYVENNPISNVDPSGLASPWADKKDAIKHCIWSCMLRKVSRRFAKSLGDLFEAETAQTRQSHEVDLANNEVGRQAPRRVNCCDWCHQKYREGKLFGPTWDPSGKPLVGPLSPIPENSQFGSGPNTTWWQGPRN